MERTEESRGGLARRLGDPVREPAPGTVATGSLGGRDSETGKRGESGKRSIPANVQPDGGRHGGWAEPVGAAYRDGNGWRGRRGDEPGLGTAGEPPGRGRGGGGRCVIMAGAAGAATAAESSAGNRAWLGGPAAIGQGATKVPRS